MKESMLVDVYLGRILKEERESCKAFQKIKNRKFHSRKDIKREMVDGRTQGVEKLERKYVSV